MSKPIDPSLRNDHYDTRVEVSVGFIGGEINELAENCCASLYHIKHFSVEKFEYPDKLVNLSQIAAKTFFHIKHLCAEIGIP